jgi:ABC-type amino acid transport substrate-binding protein
MGRLPALLVLLACAGPALAARQLLAAAAEQPVLRVGFGTEPRVPMSSLVDGQPEGMEGLLIEAIAKELGYTLEIVPLGTFEDRMYALINGTVDAVIHSFTVTAERSKLMQFVYPAYYSSGVALFAPNGEIEGVSSWSDLAGRTLAVKEGNYVLDAAPQTPALQNVTLVQVPNIQDAAALVAAGDVDGYLDDSSVLSPAPNLTIVSQLQPILRAPMAIAVRRGADDLAANLTRALLTLVQGGSDAPILGMENATFIALGAPPNPDLAALVANPTPGNSTLYPTQEMECFPVPSDSLWLPADAYQPIYTWEVRGVHNYSCDGGSGSYQLRGWLVNGTDVRNDKHTGYSYTDRGPSGTHFSRFVATDEGNRTELGSIEIIREVGSVGMPSPTDPTVNAQWYRRITLNQYGMFAAPKILYMTQTETEGGELPAGAGKCMESDAAITVPFRSIVTFFACREGV